MSGLQRTLAFWPLLVVAAGALFLLGGVRPEGELVVGGDLEHCPLLVTAHHRGHLGAAGDTRLFDTKHDDLTLGHLQSGELVLGVVGETAVARIAHVDLCEIRILGSAVRRRDFAVLVRPARIGGAQALAGRRIGLLPDVDHRIHLERFLAAQGMGHDAVRPVAMPEGRLLDRFANGHLDAVVVAGAVRRAAERRVPEARSLDARAVPVEHVLVVTTEESLARRRPALLELLAGLAVAPSELDDAGAHHLASVVGVPADVLTEVAERTRSRLELPADLVSHLERTARLLRASRRDLQGARVPDFRKLIDGSLLGSVAPERVERRSR